MLYLLDVILERMNKKETNNANDNINGHYLHLSASSFAAEEMGVGLKATPTWLLTAASVSAVQQIAIFVLQTNAAFMCF